MEAKQYRAIEAWGRSTGSHQYYIEAQQARAARENAPLDAIYRHDGDGGWATLRDLHARQSSMFRRLVRDLGGAEIATRGGTADAG